MHIAIIGAGFAGLATAWELLHQGYQVEIFDPNPIGAGTSGIAAGLINPFAGKRAKLNWMGREGVEATKKLLAISSSALGKDVILSNGLIRRALNPEQELNFRSSGANYEEVEWNELKKEIYISSALTVDCESYLKGLAKACSHLPCRIVQEKVTDLNKLKHDLIMICAGAETVQLPVCKDLHITPVKGQILTLNYNKSFTSICSKKYLTANPEKRCCFAGATYERDFESDQPDIHKAVEEIMPEIIELCPELQDKEILCCKAGVRASTKDKRPILKKINDRVWVFAGLGSKGLLYHGLFAGELSKQI